LTRKGEERCGQKKSASWKGERWVKAGPLVPENKLKHDGASIQGKKKNVSGKKKEDATPMGKNEKGVSKGKGPEGGKKSAPKKPS